MKKDTTPKPERLPGAASTYDVDQQVKAAPDPEVTDDLTATKSSRRLPKRVLAVVVAILLLVAATVVFAIISGNDDNDSSSSAPASNIDQVAGTETELYNYASINDVIEFEGYTWVGLGSGAARYNDSEIEFYTQLDGLDGPNVGSFVVHDDQLWAATSNGVSRYIPEKNTFKPYFTDITEDAFSGGLGNVYLFLNPIDNILSISSFKGFYEYAPDDDTFIATNGPVNTRRILFNDSLGVSVTWEGGSSSIAFEYQPGRGWRRAIDLSGYADQSVDVIKVEDRFVVFGRSAQYQSCASVGSAPATLFNEFTADGTLTPIDSLNQQFSRNELYLTGDGQNYDAKATNCGSSDEAAAYVFVIESSQITVKEVPNPIATYHAEAEQPYTDVINAIRSLTGREPIYEVIGVEGDGSLITMYSDGLIDKDDRGSSSVGSASSSLGYDLILDRVAIVDGNNFGEASELGQLEAADQDTFTVPVLCDGLLTYILSISASNYDGSIYNAKLYDLSGGSIAEVADLTDSVQESFGQPAVYCNEQVLQWVDYANLITFNRNYKQVTVEEEFETNRFGVALIGDILWLSGSSYERAPVGYRNMVTGEITEVKLDVDYGEQNDPKQNQFIGVSPSYIWMVLDTNPGGVVTAFNHDGTVAYQYELTSSDGYTYSGSGTLVGDNKIVLLTESSWSRHKDILLIDASSELVQTLEVDVPLRNYIGNLVYNPATSRVWVNAGDTLFSFAVE